MEFSYESNRFFKEVDGKLLAEVTFPDIDDGRNYVLDHTFVANDLRGQGIAAQLVEAVVNKARQEGKKILPLCPYAVKAFEKHPEYADVVRPR